MENSELEKEEEIVSMNDDLYNQLDITELEQRLEFGLLWGCDVEKCGVYNCPNLT